MIELICPECHSERKMMASTLSNGRFCCKVCSDGISIPEKFGIYLFRQLNIEVETQKTFEWAKSKKYDFYIKSTNTIIEVHGMQHYKEVKNWGSLTHVQSNDEEKYNLAIANGINKSDYIIIDCRLSDFEFLKNNYSKCLKELSLLNVDWIKIWKSCQSSFKLKIWDRYMEKRENDSIPIIANDFGINERTVRKYLKIGSKIGMCDYTSTKIIYQYSKEGNLIKKWKSLKDIEDNLVSPASNIYKCCKDFNKNAYGFKWSYSSKETIEVKNLGFGRPQ